MTYLFICCFCVKRKYRYVAALEACNTLLIAKIIPFPQCLCCFVTVALFGKHLLERCPCLFAQHASL